MNTDNLDLVPFVIEKTQHGERSYDIFSRLLKDRIVFLGSPLTDVVANIIIAEFLFLEHEDPEKDIYFYINSPGGSVTAALAIYDTMQLIKPDVSTIGVGLAASAGAFLLSSGAKGKRLALPNTEILLHQVIASVPQGQAIDIDITAKQIVKLKERMNRILAQNTNKPFEQVEKDTDRDFYLTAEEAKTYGVIDKVVSSRHNLSEKVKK